jgi:signal peptidase II
LKRNHVWIFFTVLTATLALDQVVKAWARGAMNEGGSLRGLPWPGVFEFKLTYNEGVAFGFFQGAGRLLSPVAIAIAVGAAWYSMKHSKEGALTHIAMALLASGALGNLYDRLVFHKVTDMFYARFIDFPVFNIADSCITVATVMLIGIWWREAVKPKPATEAVVESEPNA